MITQTLKISWMNLTNLKSRIGVSSVIIVGIAGVVCVLCAILAMANGFASTLLDTGEPDRVVVLSAGANDEMSSNVTQQQLDVISTMTSVQVAAPELFVVADIAKRETGHPANVVVRGVTDDSFVLRPEVEIIEGRNMRSGFNEVIVGAKANREFEDTCVGDTITLRNGDWQVVGIFAADGAAFESELWAGMRALQSAFQRNSATVVRARLNSAEDIDSFSVKVENDQQLQHRVVLESDFYTAQAQALNTVIEVFGYSVSIIMAIGALFAALNTMYTAVSTRTTEIATLRAIGFGSTPVVISVLIEALVLSLFGGLLGALIAYVGFNGWTVSTMNQASFSQVAFDFQVTQEIVTLGVIWAIVIGYFGGLFPAIQAALLPITAALRKE